MITILLLATVATLLAGVAQLVAKGPLTVADADRIAWDNFERSVSDQPVFKGLAKAGRTVGQTQTVRLLASSPALDGLKRKLLVGDTFAGSVEVYLSIQVAAVLIGVAIALFGALVVPDGAIIGLLGLVAALLPYTMMDRAATAREAEVFEGLPDYAEQLRMALRSGIGIGEAIGTTATINPNNAVSPTMLWLATQLRQGTMRPEAAFALASDRLSIDEAQVFLATLQRALADGSKAADAVAAQVDSLRKAAYQRQRTVIRKLPTKIILLSFMHLLPLLFVIILVPAGYTLFSSL